jgi:hypothetical protein
MVFGPPASKPLTEEDKKKLGNVALEIKKVQDDLYTPPAGLDLPEEVTNKAMNILHIEQWLNKTLVESDILKLSANERKISGKNDGLLDYGIDRRTLENSGLLTS